MGYSSPFLLCLSLNSPVHTSETRNIPPSCNIPTISLSFTIGIINRRDWAHSRAIQQGTDDVTASWFKEPNINMSFVLFCRRYAVPPLGAVVG
jgi:hypothetical protein